ncbi:hypothetical protein Trihar35433_9487 [Trichoderma harzianum]|uniref:Uncharacterized protein n=1 Tax=Trichoderma lentiforme TaxID=1567552 RepID=A0A9P5CDC8_9HYPO|nr:hypothetical protein CFAM422_004878 [Trichoderma lentiforme]KAK4061887.1 hypothetical protein Trihar35433_9487 [Trichoderma harzianum]
MLLSFNNKHIVHSLLAASLVFVSLLIYVWNVHLVPGDAFRNHRDHDRDHDDMCPRGSRRHGNSTYCVPKEIGGIKWKRPADASKIMGLIFYGRRSTVSILDCYLKRNLVKNGGILDGVIFLQRTTDEDDLKFLDKLLESEPDYTKWVIDMNEDGFASSYDRIQDDVMYIKMDDDIVYIEDSAIPSIVTTRAEHPEFFVVSSNVINQPLISWIHWNLGAVKAYLPELNKAYPAPQPGSKLNWRPSLLPSWQGADDFQVSEWNPPDHQKHRWLPVKGHSDHILDRTPIVETEYDPFGPGWKKWQVAAQEHYSLFENIENNNLRQYRFGTWDFQLKRMGIQFTCMMGKDINLAKPIAADDEHHFAVTMPEQTGRHAVADGGGVVAHFSFGAQAGDERIEQTDVLDRYRVYAEENICKGPLLWDPVLDNHNDP